MIFIMLNAKNAPLVQVVHSSADLSQVEAAVLLCDLKLLIGDPQISKVQRGFKVTSEKICSVTYQTAPHH